MKRGDLMKKAGELGFRLFEPESARDANTTLAEVVRSGDPRLWEGFPVMLANSAEAGDFKYEAVKSRLEAKDAEKLTGLLLMSAALYKTLGMKFKWADDISGMFARQLFESYAGKLEHGADIKIGRVTLPADKLKSDFMMYFKGAGESVKNTVSAREELGFEFAMSQMFTAKQKELFLKRLRHEKLTKTEREYFSRVIKKKAQALANDDLHRVARRVLE